MLNFQKSALLIALLSVVTLWTQVANAETLNTKNFQIIMGASSGWGRGK